MQAKLCYNDLNRCCTYTRCGESFLSASLTSHWDALVRVLQCLKYVSSKGLLFSYCGHGFVADFSDAIR